MQARLLDGRELAKARRAHLAQRVALLRDRGIVPHLTVISASNDTASRTYLRAKTRVAEKLGIEIEVVTLEDPSTFDIVSRIESWSLCKTVSGIMIEAPLPSEIDMHTVRQAFPAGKDVDGAGFESLGRLFSGRPAFAPATAVSALALAETTGDVAGKHVVIIGRSLVVGRPLALLLLARDATVTVCHSKTRHLSEIARRAEILFVAVGKPRFVTAEMVNPGGTVIDIGTNVVDGKLVGDVDANSVRSVAGALSPVPGGVGPLTTILLLEHVVQAAEGTMG